MKNGAPIVPQEMLESFQGAASSAERMKRFFGKGDVLRNASLEFGEASVVEIQSRFENCEIVLVEGAQLTIGVDGVLESCRISGPGEIVQPTWRLG